MAKAKGAAASKLLTAGSYEYELTSSMGIGLAAQGNVVYNFAATAETLLTWLRIHYAASLVNTETNGRHVTLVAWKSDGASVCPDITSGDVIELLRRDGKLFFLKHVFFPGPISGRGITWETEFRNVKLRAGERLNWGLYNHGAAVASPKYNEFIVKEYRKVTV